MADQKISIGIPAEVVNVPETVNVAVKAGDTVSVTFEPANDGVLTIENVDAGVFITFKKKPFETEIINPPNNQLEGGS